MKNSLFEESPKTIEEFNAISHIHQSKKIKDMSDSEVLIDFENMPLSKRECAVAPYYASLDAMWYHCYVMHPRPFEDDKLNIMDAKREVLKCFKDENDRRN